MKKIIIGLLFFSTQQATQAQSTQTASIQSELTDIANFNSHQQTGYERFQGYKAETSGSQFFTDNWATGSITSKDNKQIGGSYTLLYDKVRQLVFVKPTGSEGAGVIDNDKISYFTIQSDQTHKFVNASAYNPNDKTDYYEVMADGNHATLLKLTTTTFEKADRSTSTGVWQGKLNDAYIDHYTYFLYHDGKLDKIVLKNNNFKKALKEFAGKIDDYTTAHYGEATDETYYKNLVQSINS